MISTHYTVDFVSNWRVFFDFTIKYGGQRNEQDLQSVQSDA